MEKPPQFIKEFSSEESPEERDKVAKEIKDKRSEYFVGKESRAAREEELEETTSEREQILGEKLETLADLKKEINELESSKLKKILNNFQLNKLRADVAIGERTYEELKEQQDLEIAEQEAILEKSKSKEESSALEEARAMLSDFYREQKEKWAKTEYSKEDIMKNFSEEHLASLSIEDYELLLQRFHGEMVAHVTRQGIRDHVGHMWHIDGKGAYTDSFMRMIEDGRLRSSLGVYLVEKEKEQAIAEFLGLEDFKTKEEALKVLEELTQEKQGASGSYTDRAAIHFATEEVADSYYGSEQGNEIFIAYPSAHVASQYYFSGQLSEDGGGYWNDQWVWANEERGMDLNAGLIFIPEETRVDKKTGSRYELDKDNNPVKNLEYRAAFKRVVESAHFVSFSDEVIEIDAKFSACTDRKDPNLSEKDLKILEKLEPFRQKLEQEFGIKDKRLQFAILNYNNLSMIRSIEEKSKDEIDEIIENAMREEGILYQEAKDTISSKEFWEAHFSKDPAKKPSKIIYYKGTNPTRALKQWRKEKGIDQKASDKNVGFSERNIQPGKPQATAGMDRFKVLAEQVIENYFL